MKKYNVVMLREMTCDVEIKAARFEITEGRLWFWAEVGALVACFNSWLGFEVAE